MTDQSPTESQRPKDGRKASLPAGIALAAVVSGGALAASPADAGAEVQVYDVDAVHSGVNFRVRHLFSPTPGRFTDFAGKLLLDTEHIEKSRFDLVIQAASINTGNERRDRHVRSDDFLAVERFPTITFVSTAIEPLPAKQAAAGAASAGGSPAVSAPQPGTPPADQAQPRLFRVRGDLTIRGITRPVDLEVEMLGFGDVPGMGRRGGFIARTTINRMDFGVKWNQLLEAGSTLLGDELAIECPIEVVQVTAE